MILGTVLMLELKHFSELKIKIEMKNVLHDYGILYMPLKIYLAIPFTFIIVEERFLIFSAVIVTSFSFWIAVSLNTTISADKN